MDKNYTKLKIAYQNYIKTQRNSKNASLSTVANASGFQDFLKNSNVQINAYSLNISDYINKLENENETLDILNNTKSDEENFMESYYDEILNDEDVKRYIDVDGDNEISQEETQNFFASMSDDGEEISLEKTIEKLNEIKNIDDEKSVSSDNVDNQDTSSTSGGFNSGGNVGNSTSKSDSSKNYSNMSLEELETEKNAAQDNLQENQNNLNAVLDGSDSIVQAAQENLDKKQEELEKALEEDDKISDELKEKQKQSSQAVVNQENAINSKKIEISNKEIEISNTTAQIQACESQKTAFQAALTTLSTQTSQDGEVQTQISNQTTVVQAQIEQIDAQIQQLETQKANLEEEKANLETSLVEDENLLVNLKQDQAEIEAQILESADEKSIKALEALNDERSNFEEIKNSQLSKAQELLKTSQAELEQINAQINIKEAKKITKENNISQENNLWDNLDGFEVQEIVKDGTIPYLLIGPKNVDANADLPVLVYLHGKGQVGNGVGRLNNVGPGEIIPNWDLENFNGYILCPSLSGEYINSGSWCNANAQQYIRDMVEDFTSDHNVDSDKIAIAGHSLGGQGAIYMAAKMPDLFSKAATLSGYMPNIKASDIQIPIKGYIGSGDDGNSISNMQGLFRRLNEAGAQDSELITVSGGHSQVPQAALTQDTNGNRRSDLIEWLFED